MELAEVDSDYPEEFGAYAPGYYGDLNQSSEKQMLYQFLATVRKRWLLILTITLTATFAVFFYVAQKPDYYKAAARVQVNAENTVLPSGRDGGSSPIVISSQSSDPAYFATQLQILEGSKLLQRVVKTLDLENNPHFLRPAPKRPPTFWQNATKIFTSGSDSAEDTEEPGPRVEPKENLALRTDDSPDDESDTERLAPLVAKIKQNLVVSPVKDNRTANKETRLIQIEYTHGDPELVSKITNTIADLYVLQNLEQKVQSHASAGDFFQKRVAELQSAIRLDEERLINYSKTNQLVSLDPSQNTVVQRLTSVNQQLGEAVNDRIAAQTSYQAALQNQMRAATAEGQDAQASGLAVKLNDLRQRLAQLKTEYTDEWWEVVQTKKQIENVEGQLSTVRNRAMDVQLAGLKQKLDEATAREKQLRGDFDKQRDDVIRQNEASINFRIIQQEIDTNKSLLASLLQRSRENDIILNDTPNNVLVSERAVIPNGPSGPERSQTVILAFLVSLVGGCGLAFLLGWLDDSIHGSTEIESLLGVPLLATVPAARGSFADRVLWGRLLGGGDGRSRNDNYELALFESPVFTESYVQLRTHLMLSRAGGPPKTILVTSGEAREGKTVTALNLALSLSEGNRKVLLIDGDLRCPRIETIRGLNKPIGLTTLLTADELTEEMIGEAIQQDNKSDLHILGAGERSVNPTNLLDSDEMRSLIKRLGSIYSHIVIDSPPMLYFADSTILSLLVDSVVLVVRDGRTPKQTLFKVQRLLQAVGARVSGVVMNAVPQKDRGYYQYDYYRANSPAAENNLQPLNLQ